jgi:GPH family glycoside/pentoside/hexuronide:cation symporter
MTAERVPLSTKLSYGLGAVAYGIKDNGFSVFLLLFYNQVVGLPAEQVGFAIMIALFVDAFVDPAIGSLSDRTHTRIGRRHPWLYGSAIPIALCWVLLWNPPQAGTAATLGYLVVIAILVRAAISTNEVPSAAMVPELTRDYHERTAVIRYRYVFGWAGGLAMLMLAYGYLLRPPTGPTAGPGYHNFGVVGAIVMLVSVLASAIGTHKRLAHPPKVRIATMTVGKEVRAILSTLSNRAFVLLICAGVFAYINQGIAFAMSNYLLSFVWLFRPVDLQT